MRGVIIGMLLQTICCLTMPPEIAFTFGAFGSMLLACLIIRLTDGEP